MIKNNNPGNIRFSSANPWRGQIAGAVSSPPGFVVFDSLENGYRALMILLQNYISGGFNTIEKIITRYAPPAENNTQAYINFVAGFTDIPPDEILQAGDLFRKVKIAQAISEMEHSGTLSLGDVAALQAAAGKLGTNVDIEQQAGPNLAMLIIGGLLLASYLSTRK